MSGSINPSKFQTERDEWTKPLNGVEPNHWLCPCPSCHTANITIGLETYTLLKIWPVGLNEWRQLKLYYKLKCDLKIAGREPPLQIPKIPNIPLKITEHLKLI